MGGNYSWHFKEARRKRFRALALFFILFLNTFFMFGMFPRTNMIISPLIMLSWGATVISFLYWWASWVYLRCPRCGNYFYITFIYNWPFGSKCVHCGLKGEKL